MQARGSERYGIVVHHSWIVWSARDWWNHLWIQFHWFLDNKDDVRSSYYLEDVATEFDVQGLNSTGCVWHWMLTLDIQRKAGASVILWHALESHKYKDERKIYLKMPTVFCVTRHAKDGNRRSAMRQWGSNTHPCILYDETFHYLKDTGFPVI